MALGNRQELADFPPQGTEDREWFFALRAQPGQRARSGSVIALEGAVAQIEGCIARAVGDHARQRASIQRAGFGKELEFLDFLARREQIALDPLGQHAQRLLIRAETGGLQPLPQPAGQVATAHRPRTHADARLIERLEPGGFLGIAIARAQMHRDHRVGGRMRRDLAQHGSPFSAGLSGGDANLEEFAVAEERHARTGGAHP